MHKKQTLRRKHINRDSELLHYTVISMKINENTIFKKIIIAVVVVCGKKNYFWFNRILRTSFSLADITK